MIGRLCLRIEKDQTERDAAAQKPFAFRLSFTRADLKGGAAKDDFDRWYEKWAPKTNTLILHEFDILDELSLLLEQIRSKRQTRAA
jgi:hypothetical protein